MIRFKPLAICTSLLAIVLLTGAVSGRPGRTTARLAKSWTTELGTFTPLPTPNDSTTPVTLFAVSPNGDSSVGVTWEQGRPVNPKAYMFGYMTEDLTRKYRAFGFPTVARAVNDAGDVAGFWVDSTITTSTVQHGFVYRGGHYLPVEFPGSHDNNAAGINNAGTVVGAYFLPDRSRHQYMYNEGTFTSFDLPDSFGACNTVTHGISSNGAIVGSYQVPDPHLNCGGLFRAYVRYPDGTFAGFDATPDAISTEAWAINDRGDIVGLYSTSDTKTHGYLMPGNGEPAITIDFPHWNGNTQTQGIDESGRIIVGGTNGLGGLGGPPGFPFKLTLCDSGDHNQQQQGRNRVGTHGGRDEQCGHQDQAATRSRD